MGETFLPIKGTTAADVDVTTDVQYRNLMASYLRSHSGVVPYNYIEPTMGTFAFGEMLKPFADSTGLNVKVKAGVAMSQGVLFVSDAQVTLAISTADATNPRWDAVVVDYDFGNDTYALSVVTGTPAATPSYPSLTRDSDEYQVLLGYVYVDSNVLTISASDVRDFRDYCSALRNLHIGIGNEESELPVDTLVEGIRIPHGMHVTRIDFLANTAGSAQLDIRLGTSGGFPLGTGASVGILTLDSEQSVIASRNDDEIRSGTSDESIFDWEQYVFEQDYYLTIASLTAGGIYQGSINIEYYDLGGEDY